jgi:hypothetical protein
VKFVNRFVNDCLQNCLYIPMLNQKRRKQLSFFRVCLWKALLIKLAPKFAWSNYKSVFVPTTTPLHCQILQHYQHRIPLNSPCLITPLTVKKIHSWVNNDWEDIKWHLHVYFSQKKCFLKILPTIMKRKYNNEQINEHFSSWYRREMEDLIKNKQY